MAGTDAKADDEFSQRMRREGDLAMALSEHIWNAYRPFRLDGEEFECVGGDEVPGYGDEEYAILLRRKSDGQVFEAEIDVTMRPVMTPEQREAQAAGYRRPVETVELPS